MGRGSPDQRVGHSNEQLQSGALKPKQAGSLRKVLSTDSSTHRKLDVMGRGQREQSCQIEAVGLGHKEEWHSWSSASNPAQRMGEDLHRLLRVGQGLMRASLILIPCRRATGSGLTRRGPHYTGAGEGSWRSLRANCELSLSLSLSHTHTHTHTYTLSLATTPVFLLLAFLPYFFLPQILLADKEPKNQNR